MCKNRIQESTAQSSVYFLFILCNVQERHQLHQHVDKLSKDLQDKSEQEVTYSNYT